MSYTVELHINMRTYMLAYEAKFWCLVHQVILRNAEQAQ